jgi:hypothetical protein
MLAAAAVIATATAQARRRAIARPRSRFDLSNQHPVTTPNIPRRRVRYRRVDVALVRHGDGCALASASAELSRNAE